MEIKMMQFQTHGDERGALIALEENKNIPFEVKRVYFMSRKESIAAFMHTRR